MEATNPIADFGDASIMKPTKKQTGQAAEHLVAYQLVKCGWDVTFLGSNVPSYDMIAYKNGIGARTIQVKGTTGLKDDYSLGNPDEWSADWLIFVVDPIGNPEAYLYQGNLVTNCPVGAKNNNSLIVRDKNPGKKTGYRVAWIVARRFNKDPQVEANGWGFLDHRLEPRARLFNVGHGQ